MIDSAPAPLVPSWVSRLRASVQAEAGAVVPVAVPVESMGREVPVVEASVEIRAAEMLEPPVPAVSRVGGRYAVCSAGGERLAIPLDYVLEIRAVPHCSPIPGVGSPVRGLATLREAAICVVELAGLLAQDCLGDASSERLLVVKPPRSRQPVGFVADSVLDLALLASPEAASPASGPCGEFLRESCLAGTEQVRVLDVEGLLASKLIRMLAIPARER